MGDSDSPPKSPRNPQAGWIINMVLNCLLQQYGIRLVPGTRDAEILPMLAERMVQFRRINFDHLVIAEPKVSYRFFYCIATPKLLSAVNGSLDDKKRLILAGRLCLLVTEDIDFGQGNGRFFSFFKRPWAFEFQGCADP